MDVLQLLNVLKSQCDVTPVRLMSCDRTFLSRDKNVDLTGVSSCRAESFECL